MYYKIESEMEPLPINLGLLMPDADFLSFVNKPGRELDPSTSALRLTARQMEELPLSETGKLPLLGTTMVL
jgi:hypothetical protein